MNKVKQTPKLDKAAKEYMTPALYYKLYDCCDSMRDSEKLEARFDALADDKISVNEYIMEYLLPEYIECIKTVADENGEAEEVKNWKEYLENSPSTFPEKILNYFN